MKLALRGFILFGLCVAVSCSQKAAGLVVDEDFDPTWRQKYLVAELVEAQKSTEVKEVPATANYIVQLYDSLQGAYAALEETKRRHRLDSTQHSTSLASRLLKILQEAVESFNGDVYARTKDQLGVLDIDWFDGLRGYLSALVSLVRMNSVRCSGSVLRNYLQTINLFNGERSDAFIDGADSERYPKFKAFLLHYGKESISKCLTDAKLLGDRLKPEHLMDSLLTNYGKLVGGQAEMREAQLFELAAGFDLVDGDYDAKQLIASLPPISDGGAVWAAKKSPFDRFYDRFQPMCPWIRSNSINVSDIEHLGRFLMPGTSLPMSMTSRARKLKAYERIYSKFCSATKKEVAANFKRNKPPSGCGNFLCGLGFN